MFGEKQTIQTSVTMNSTANRWLLKELCLRVLFVLVDMRYSPLWKQLVEVEVDQSLSFGVLVLLFRVQSPEGQKSCAANADSHTGRLRFGEQRSTPVILHVSEFRVILALLVEEIRNQLVKAVKAQHHRARHRASISKCTP